MLASLDAFPKTLEDFKERTTRGGWTSVVTSSFILILLIHEITRFCQPEVITSMHVDDSRGGQLHLYIDVDFPYLACASIGIDAIDVSGKDQLEIEHDVYKTPISVNGVEGGKVRSTKAHQMHRTVPEGLPENYCGKCIPGVMKYGTRCCNTCSDVQRAYDDVGLKLPPLDHIEQCVREGHSVPDAEHEQGGCNIRGLLKFAKVAGSFHISPGHSVAFMGMAFRDTSIFLEGTVNLTHTINRFSFGTPTDEFDDEALADDYVAATKATRASQRRHKIKSHWNYETADPLDGVEKISIKTGQYMYYLQVVPTTLRRGYQTVDFEQYSVTEIFRPTEIGPFMEELPGLFFRYDMNPIRVDVQYKRPPFTRFLVRTSAIIGGVFAFSNLIHKLIGLVQDRLRPRTRKAL
ncbi:hypothetical protein NDN08_005586 [Rhodosorus marinus]|uniref:Endoplasmic reticulum vesicle transporter C-terminal domain-containing protein n=1 Tax=Rhodosorus marinus TaxID=101924 RepID=A0AAV8V4F3_9RHOD|nr:hypothetical protein NDN08_005586 [Rhodosorus marinus]